MALLQNTSLTNEGVSISDVEYYDLVHKLCKTVVIIIIIKGEEAKDTDDFIIFNYWDIEYLYVFEYLNFPTNSNVIVYLHCVDGHPQ